MKDFESKSLQLFGRHKFCRTLYAQSTKLQAKKLHIIGKNLFAGVLVLIGTLFSPMVARSADYVVYGVYRPVDLGNPGDIPKKDYYLNMGSSSGLRVGSVVEVSRKIPTYDMANEKLHRDITFPIAKLKIIHVEASAAVGRIEKFYPEDSTPSMSPREVMIGDIVEAK